ncbi:SIS domain-containing protein, partial [Sphingomonas sp. 179-A 2A2 NHS]|uniref:SIS domain-containing protein n=1 Tax=Sphingomonas sp. 179-A 2A2 NHS TaxID=3374290 RepID=UPI003879ECFF
SGDAALLDSVKQAGEVLRAAHRADWSAAIPALAEARSLLVLGRGFTLPIAGEAALKLKETAGLHAEAFSVAEVAHGPMTLVDATDPVLVFGPLDQAREGLPGRIADFAARGAMVIAAGREEDVGDAAIRWTCPPNADPVLGSIAYIQSFYGLANAVATSRGRDPDRPPHLSKVTRTL